MTSTIATVEPTNAAREDALPPTTELSGEAPTVALNTGMLPTMAQHCTRCGAQLAVDQRYCVQCGERRGEPRLPFMDGRTHTPAAVADAPPPPPPAKGRFSSGATLIAGVGTLLLALGVGVVIGNMGKGDETTAAAAPSVITVQGSAAATTDTTSAADASATGAKDAKDASSKDSGDKSSKSAAEEQKAAKAVIKTEGDIPQAKAPVVKKGEKGSGPGYKDGKFTGDFFGQ